MLDADGPGNSKIRTTTYGGLGTAWKIQAEKEWIFKNGKVEAGADAFELNLPASVSEIVWTFATQARKSSNATVQVLKAPTLGRGTVDVRPYVPSLTGFAEEAMSTCWAHS